MSDVPRDMARAGLEFAAAEAAAERRVDAQVQAMVDDGAPASPGAPVTNAAPAAPSEPQAVELPPEATKKLCGVAWAVVDRIVQNLAGKELALTADERDQLAGLTVPVLDKHLPELLKKLLGTPEGVLLATAGLIYASKAPAVFGLDAGAPPASSPPQTGATA